MQETQEVTADLVSTSIDQGLDSIGETAKRVVYFRVEQDLKIRRSEIPANCKLFVEELQQIFGPGGKVLEKSILAKLGEVTGRSDLPRDFCKAVEVVSGRKG